MSMNVDLIQSIEGHRHQLVTLKENTHTQGLFFCFSLVASTTLRFQFGREAITAKHSSPLLLAD